MTACSVSITGFRLALTSQWLGLRLASDLIVKGAVLEQRHPIKYRVLGTSARDTWVCAETGSVGGPFERHIHATMLRFV